MRTESDRFTTDDVRDFIPSGTKLSPRSKGCMRDNSHAVMGVAHSPFLKSGTGKFHRNERATLMKRATEESLLKHRIGTISGIFLGLLVGTVLGQVSMVAGADEGFQHNALFNPSKEQIMAEARGRIMIYDGLDNEVVERALDEQFERIEHMMFVHIQHAQPDGDVTVEDDGC